MFKKIIDDLIGAGLTESQIAEKVGVSQPTINRVRNGKQKPMYLTGESLKKLHTSYRRKFKQAA